MGDAYKAQFALIRVITPLRIRNGSRTGAVKNEILVIVISQLFVEPIDVFQQISGPSVGTHKCSLRLLMYLLTQSSIRVRHWGHSRALPLHRRD